MDLVFQQIEALGESNAVFQGISRSHCPVVP